MLVPPSNLHASNYLASSPLAVCSWLFGDCDHEQIAQWVARLGVDSVELLTDIDRCSPATLRRLYKDIGLSVRSLTPKNVDIAHHQPSRRAGALSYYRRLIVFAAELGCHAVTCHEGIGRLHPVDSAEAEWHRLVSGLCCKKLPRIR